MANPTTNYSWVLPTPTDLVTDLPADFDVALQGVDNTVKALNPETTLGDISYRSATANTNTRLGIGSSGQVLTVSGGVPAWSTISAGGMTTLASGSLTGATLDLTSISGSYKSLQLVMRNVSTNADSALSIRINNDSTTNYRNQSIFNGTVTNYNTTGEIYITDINTFIDQSSIQGMFVIDFPDYASVSAHNLTYSAGYVNSTSGATVSNYGFCYYRPTTNAAISRITIRNASSNTFDNGTYTLYGVS